MSAAAVSIDTRQVKELIKLLSKAALSPAESRNLMRNIATEVESSTVERFTTKKAPDGSPWKELSEVYAEYLAGKHPEAEPQLVVSGELRDTIESQVSVSRALVGATKIYAAPHQFGWPEKNIPARPFLGISDADVSSLEGIITDFLEART